jgi:flagellar basal-body rod modification protein FlgD
MSAVSGTSGLGTTAAGLPSRFNQLTSEDFMKIMFTELSNQDPLKPNDSNTLLQQFSSLRSIEADLALQTKLSDVVSQNQLSTAGALLGKRVAGYTETFDVTDGIVRSISQTSDGPVLNLSNGARVPYKNVQTILEPTP